MPFVENVKNKIYNYCQNHLPEDNWYEETFEFIEDTDLKKRLIEEFKGVRFAYKLYEGIEAKDENLIFQIRHQILTYASIYEAVIHYVLYNYYNDTEEVDKLNYHNIPARIDIPSDKKITLQKELVHNGDPILIYHKQRRRRDKTKIRFDEKCEAAKDIGIITDFLNDNEEKIEFISEIIKIYEYRNAIHLVAERRKGISYELEMSELAYRRMQPFINQIKSKLREDNKGIYRINETES